MYKIHATCTFHVIYTKHLSVSPSENKGIDVIIIVRIMSYLTLNIMFIDKVLKSNLTIRHSFSRPTL